MADATVYTHLDQYCERGGDPGLWAEPLNAVTNLAFIIAGILAVRAWRNSSAASFRNSIDLLLLILLLFAIGVGSGLWHFYATSDTMMLDVIPIVLFMNLFLLSAAIRLLNLRWWGALILFGVFQGLNYAANVFLPSGFLNGTIMYLPAYAILFAIVIWARILRVPSKHLLLQALVVWTVSLVCRTLDTDLCPTIPFGLHFLWHVFNAAVLYKLLQSLIMMQAYRAPRR